MANHERIQEIQALKTLLLKPDLTVAELEEARQKQTQEDLKEITQEAINGFTASERASLFETFIELLSMLETSGAVIGALGSLSATLDQDESQ